MLFFKKKESKPTEPVRSPDKTFTFKPVGVRFECKFPCRWGGERQIVLMRSKIGDPISLQPYEWNGALAFAVMNDRLGGDVGTVSRKNISKVKALLQDYNVSGVITKFDTFDDDLTGLEVRLNCFKRGEL